MTSTDQLGPDPLCPNQDAHQWHPTGYIQHSNWADHALVIATQSRCPGCGGLDIWTPKRPDLQITGADWNSPNCAIGDETGRCDQEAICWRNILDTQAPLWVPVCADHTGLQAVPR